MIEEPSLQNLQASSIDLMQFGPPPGHISVTADCKMQFGQPDGSLGGFESCKKGPNDSQKVVKTITLTSKMPGSSQD